MIPAEHQCNLAYCGHIPQLATDRDGTSGIFSMSIGSHFDSIDKYDELLDEMLETMTEQREGWIYWFDIWKLEVGGE